MLLLCTERNNLITALLIKSDSFIFTDSAVWHYMCFEYLRILYFPIPHNALSLPPRRRFCINYCCEILLGIGTSPKSISQQWFMQNLGGKHSALWGVGK